MMTKAIVPRSHGRCSLVDRWAGNTHDPMHLFGRSCCMDLSV